MATKKNETKNELPKSVWANAPQDAVDTLELTAFAVPAGAVTRELLAVGSELLAAMPEQPTDAQAGAAVFVRKACELTARALEHREVLRASALDGGQNHNRMIAAVTGVTGVLDAMARTAVPEVATEGRALKQELFGVGFDPGRLPTRALFTVVEAMEAKVKAEPALRARLGRMVPEALMTQLFGTYAALRRTPRVGPLTGEGVGLRHTVVRARLRRCIAHYVVTCLASVAPDASAEEVARVHELLEPLTSLRADVARRRQARSRRAGAGAGSAPDTVAPPPDPADEEGDD